MEGDGKCKFILKLLIYFRDLHNFIEGVCARIMYQLLAMFCW